MKTNPIHPENPKNLPVRTVIREGVLSLPCYHTPPFTFHDSRSSFRFYRLHRVHHRCLKSTVAYR
jgi:hypothetical protein